MDNSNGPGASNQTGDINALVDEKISNDADFQTEIELLSDEDKTLRLADKKAELIASEYSSLAQKAKKDAELANNYKIRAEKAERGEKPTVEVKPQGTLSTKDTIALIEAKVPSDDIEEVEEYAKFKGISVAEALKSSVVKSVLAEKAEMRRTAEATNVKATSRKSTKPTDILQKASEGIMPESEDDIREMARARREQLLNKNKR
jgi:hypothetical protein